MTQIGKLMSLGASSRTRKSLKPRSGKQVANLFSLKSKQLPHFTILETSKDSSNIKKIGWIKKRS